MRERSWGTFSTSCLIGVGDAASADQLQKLLPRLRLTAEGAQHRAADRDGVLLFDPPHHHAKMPRFDDHAHSMSIELRFQGFSDLDSESLLDLQPARKDVHDAWNLAEPHHFLIRQVPDMDSAIKWQEMMFTHAEKVDVFHDHHLIVLDREEGTVQEMIDVAMIALGHEGEGLGDPLRSLEQPVPARLFADGKQHLCHQGLQHSQICRPATPVDIFDRLPALPPDSLLSHVAPL
jgi:hypothetical protein